MSGSEVRIKTLNGGWEFSAADWLKPDQTPRRLGFSVLEWLPAQVPGHVHTDLVRHGVLRDPFEARAELGCQWVDETVWHYRLTDTCCDVSLNGERLLRHDNMFTAAEADVSSRLRAGANELRVRFEPAARIGRERRRNYLQREGLPENVARFDERAFVRKAQYMFAWDWGPRLVSAGIWKSVSLIEYTARLLDVHVLQHHLPNGAVELRFVSEVEGAGEVLHYCFGRWLREGEVLTLERPQLWWPAGLGRQVLHPVESVLVAPGGAPERAESVLDRRLQRIGLRRLEFLREPDARGESFEFRVNGERLWAVGANWIPDHSFPSMVDRARLSAQLRRALDMNMNMLRVWGGGVYESDDFYDLCDELGLLVWQDFPFACSYVPDDESMQHAVRAEARENVRRLRNHPSLALWCGNNENLTMWHSQWDRPLPQPTRYYGDRLYDGVLADVVAEYDAGRCYIASSPIGGDNANDGNTGDQHYWDVWHGRGDYKYYRDSTARFASEFGFASAPCHGVWAQLYAGVEAPLRRPVRDPIARWHDKTGKGYETYIGYVELHYPVAADLEEFTYFSQLNQRDALRYAIEHYRRSDFCRGSLIWQLNDCWPVQSWAVLDAAGAYKAAAFELRRLYAPLLVSIDRPEHSSRISVWLISDNTRSSVNGELVLEAHALGDGRLVERWQRTVLLEPDSRVCALEVEASFLPAQSTVLTARLLGAGPVAAAVHLLAEPMELVLPEVQLSAWPHEDGVMLRSDRPFIDLQVWDETGAFQPSENFLTRVTAGEVLVRGAGRPQRLEARSMRGRHAIRF
jgi:beta-mannosidase